jgi:hypothetical protein
VLVRACAWLLLSCPPLSAPPRAPLPSNFANNRLTGSLPSYINGMITMSIVRLENNLFTGGWVECVCMKSVCVCVCVVGGWGWGWGWGWGGGGGGAPEGGAGGLACSGCRPWLLRLACRHAAPRLGHPGLLLEQLLQLHSGPGVPVRPPPNPPPSLCRTRAVCSRLICYTWLAARQ